jgi:hypothetical protein
MGVPTYQPIANITLGSSATSVTFSNITQQYRDLVLVVNIVGVTGTPTATGSGMRVNNDSGANYFEVAMAGTGSSALSDTQTNQIFLPLSTAEGSVPSVTIVNFMDYSATDKHKTILQRGSRPDAQVNARAQRWGLSSAIHTINLFAPDFIIGTQDTWNTGSSFALYGILA